MISLDKRILSVDMGSHSYKIIEAKVIETRQKPELQILRYGLYPTEQFIDIASSLKELRRLGYRTKNAVLSFHHPSLMVRGMVLPADDNTFIQNNVKETIGQYEREFKDEFDYDYSVNTMQGDSGLCKATAFAVSKNTNREYIMQAIRLGLRPVTVDVQLSAVFRVINMVLEAPCLLIDFGYENITAGIGTKEGIVVLKVIPMGAGLILSDVNRLSDVLYQLLTTCNHLTDHYIHNYELEPLTHGILYGGGLYLPEIAHYLKEQIPLEWNDLQSYRKLIAGLPKDMDLNNFGNCLGSLFWKDEEEGRNGK